MITYQLSKISYFSDIIFPKHSMSTFPIKKYDKGQFLITVTFQITTQVILSHNNGHFWSKLNIFGVIPLFDFVLAFVKFQK